MRLSIITINYNNHDGLQKTIDSVVSQTFKDFEWVVIDGGSTDGSRELIEQFADRIAYWVSEPDRGVYHAMNKGIAQAKGEYLQFLNSGDWLYDKAVLERCFNHDFDADVMYGNCVFHYAGYDSQCCYPSRLTFERLYKGNIAHCASFIRREVLANEGYNEELKIASDLEFWMKLALRNGTFHHLEEFVAVFDTTGLSSTNKEVEKAERAYLEDRYVPKMVREDYRRLAEMNQVVADNQVQAVIQYGHKNKFNHKIITAALVVIRFFEKLFG